MKHPLVTSSVKLALVIWSPYKFSVTAVEDGQDRIISQRLPKLLRQKQLEASVSPLPSLWDWLSLSLLDIMMEGKTEITSGGRDRDVTTPFPYSTNVVGL